MKIYEECKDPKIVTAPEGCWHCAASLVCRVDEFFEDPECKRRTGRWQWFRDRAACY